MKQFIVTECKEGWVVEVSEIQSRQVIENEHSHTAVSTAGLGTLITRLANEAGAEQAAYTALAKKKPPK